MHTPVDAREIQLLERYSSIEYFGELRDTWENLVRHVESSLERFMLNLPARYRSSPLPEQPDVVWGERVLPNFRDTLEGLNTGFVLLSHHDVRGLHYAWGPRNDFHGQKNYSSDWMTKEEEVSYGELLIHAATMASNICATEGAYWKPMSLIKQMDPKELADLPVHQFSHKINQAVSVKTGEKPVRSGVYVPDIEHSCAEFLSSYYEAPSASVLRGIQDLLHPTTGEKYGEQPQFEAQSCIWYIVESSSDDVTESELPADPTLQCHRVAAGEPCPEAGYYFTPAQADSRAFFARGVVMPDIKSEYGAAIWQWDGEQR
jgi:hypothetical protein